MDSPTATAARFKRPQARVLIADDYAPARLLVAYLCDRAEGSFEVVAMVASADAAIERARREPIDIAVIDSALPGGGVRAVKAIRALREETVVVGLSTVSGEDREAFDAMVEAGAAHAFAKGTPIRVLTTALEDAHRRWRSRPRAIP